MDKIRIGILGTSDVAFRRFLPSLMKNPHFEYVGVASRDVSKTKMFIDKYGGEGFEGYDTLVKGDIVDALYIPLPPALHYPWAKKALMSGKHVMVEKPFTTTLDDTISLVNIAKEHELSIHENYMFVYHSQIEKIQELLVNGEIGEVRLIRASFGFPFRGRNDFRYNQSLGGGALLDCGGYPIKLVSLLLGKSARIVTSRLNYSCNYDVDIYGSATVENDLGVVAQIGFGMDNSYKCELEIWGSEGNVKATRVFTAPNGYSPEFILTKGETDSVLTVEPDDQFAKSLDVFYRMIRNRKMAEDECEQILHQANMIDLIRSKTSTSNLY